MPRSASSFFFHIKRRPCRHAQNLFLPKGDMVGTGRRRRDPFQVACPTVVDLTEDQATDDLNAPVLTSTPQPWDEPGEGVVEQVLGQIADTVASLRTKLLPDEPSLGQDGLSLEAGQQNEDAMVSKEQGVLGDLDLRRQLRRMEHLSHEIGQTTSPTHLYHAYRQVTELHLGSYLLSATVYGLIRRSLLRDPDRSTDARVSQTYQDQRQALGLSLEETEAWAMLLSRSGRFQEAESILQELRDNGIRWTRVGWQALLYGLTGQGEMSVARAQKRRMIQQGIQPDAYIYSYFILGYLREGQVKEAEKLCHSLCSTMSSFTGNEDTLGHDTEPLNGVLLGLVLRDRHEMARSLYTWMQELPSRCQDQGSASSADPD
ncbi:hypothetical protein BJ684DRAFT_19921 [Piptocephalis cylindrospora]|uniref:Uncharacterized protein n=1 Tax=Piptocephalis cylindrospora TaxID=1907219 RepID=A0A4P9Y4L0_9FUNG|nr:hypothetical protein BJ684DRAFT_19921 [Piptocephalis cylindrospora]|eukprot:RKP13602.1 hypothetical protein BJ684DRAFT_19921 [Piptocephalis cylindrospora]